jgi:TatD DNase family protein
MRAEMREGEREKISLVDVHAHLDGVEDLAQSLQKAKAAGVIGVVAVGMDIESNKKILEIAEENKRFVFPALGYHPWEIDKKGVGENLSFIQNHIRECVALGEIGLDYRVKVKKELQYEVFEVLLGIAHEYEKPIILHCRYSHRHAFKMVKERRIKQAVFHWYSGPLDLLDEILAIGYSISATPALVYSPSHQEAIKRTPLEKILLETDTPVNYQGIEARPKDVRVSLDQVARLKGLGAMEVSKQTTANASRFFKILFDG